MRRTYNNVKNKNEASAATSDDADNDHSDAADGIYIFEQGFLDGCSLSHVPT
jgi:hypothetical protein